MANIEEVRNLASYVLTLRPGWDAIAVQNQLLAHRQLPLDQLTAAAVKCAQDQTNRLPASLKWLDAYLPNKSSERKEDWREPKCYTCGRAQSQCLRFNQWEIERGLPYPHSFQTLDEAERHAAGRQL